MLNALHFFFLKISKPSALAAMTVLTFFFFWLINFHGVPGVPRIDSLLRIGIPDMMFSYSPSSIHSKLAQFGSEGRRAYRLFLERVDFIFPVVYGFFFVMTITFGLARLFPNRRSLQKFSLLPWPQPSLITPRMVASSSSSIATPGNCKTSRNSRMYSLSPSGLSRQLAFCCCLRCFLNS